MTMYLLTKKVLLLAVMLLFPAFSMAVEEGRVEKCFHTPFGLYLTPIEAWTMKTDKQEAVLLVDVRTRAEVQYVGFADMADANIPIMFQPGSYNWQVNKKNPAVGSFAKQKNPEFVAAMDKLLREKGLDRDAPVILMCAAGKRSTAAAKALHKAGYARVFNLFEGFEGFKAEDGYFKGQRVVNGWKNTPLPWGYDLPASKMYFNFAP